MPFLVGAANRRFRAPVRRRLGPFAAPGLTSAALRPPHVVLKKHRRFWSPAQNALTTTQIIHHPKEPNFAAKRAVY